MVPWVSIRVHRLIFLGLITDCIFAEGESSRMLRRPSALGFELHLPLQPPDELLVAEQCPYALKHLFR